ncbi:MAG TPA: choice-of-anchor Q domain-containing protein, partial [Caldilineaceae bacterium]|nr:choice-of-anchor Q domain-containing protein [Caldilineaceae bacterium]
TVEFATFSGNRADSGGAIWNNGGTNTITLSKSILANSRDEANSFDQLECDGPSLTTAGYNIIQDGSCFSTEAEGDLRNTDPALGPLQNNGGFSLTHLPASGSPAVDRVPAAQCRPDDQRRAWRVHACDSGAVERGALFPTIYVPIVLR